MTNIWGNSSTAIASSYEVQQQLAAKAGRRTLLARDLETQELVVVKILSFGNDFKWDDLKLFEREAETLKSLSHPAIPRYLDSFELDSPHGKEFVLVQSYVQGKSLEEHLKAGRTFTEQEVRQIAQALLEILIDLHRRQPPLIHRDIKPSNVLLTSRSGNSVGQVYLVDFGSVQTISAGERGTFTVVGTYGYMPLEQFGGRTVPASDLYSLGATLIYLVTGTHPADLQQLDGRIQFEQAANISFSFANWLKRMTEPSLDRRFVSAKSALQALDGQDLGDQAPLVVNKPTGSKVSLSLDVNSLEILIPHQGFNPAIVGLCCFALPWNSFILFWTAVALTTPFPINLICASVSVPFWAVGIGMVVTILFSLFGRVRLRIDRQQIFLTHELFGFKYHRPRPARIQDISKLEYSKRFQVKPQINVWAGTSKYELGGNGLLSEPEIDWLAQFLSDWLGMPINAE